MRIQATSVRFLLFLTVLAATVVASNLSDRRVPEQLSRPLSTIPHNLAGWNSVGDEPLTDTVIAVLKPTTYLSRNYQMNGQKLGLFIAYYAQQRAGETMHSPKHCLPGSGWQIWNYDSTPVATPQGTAKINRFYIQNNGDRAVVLYWYQTRNRITASEYLGKLLTIRDAVLDGRTAGSIVRITCADEPGAVTHALDFAARLIPEFQQLFSD